MILELALGAGLAASLGAGAFAAWRLRRRRRAEPAAAAERAGLASTRARGLKDGDVLLIGREELWLSGSVRLEEDGFVAELHRTPPAPGAWVLQRDLAARELCRVRERPSLLSGPTPDRLRVDGHLLVLIRSGQAILSMRGEELPPLPRRANYALLGSSTGRVLLSLGFDDGRSLVVAGEHLPADQVELLPGGDLQEGR